MPKKKKKVVNTHKHTPHPHKNTEGKSQPLSENTLGMTVLLRGMSIFHPTTLQTKSAFNLCVPARKRVMNLSLTPMQAKAVSPAFPVENTWQSKIEKEGKLERNR